MILEFLPVYISRRTEYIRIVGSYWKPLSIKPKQRVLYPSKQEKITRTRSASFGKLHQEILEKYQGMETVRVKHLYKRLEAFLDSGKESTFSYGFQVKNYGVLACQKLWKDLNLDNFFIYRQQTVKLVRTPSRKRPQSPRTPHSKIHPTGSLQIPIESRNEKRWEKVCPGQLFRRRTRFLQ